MRRLTGDLAIRVTVIALGALRNGEAAGLGWDDLVLEGPRPRMVVRHQAKDQWARSWPAWTRPLTPPKGGKVRIVALHPTALLALLAQKEALAARGWYRPDGPVFPSPQSPEGGTAMWRPNANCIKPRVLKRLARLAGVAELEAAAWVTHSLRHSAATLESEAGAPLRQIQGRTGHGSLRVLEDYIHRKTGLAPSAIPALAVRFTPDDSEDP